MRFLWSSDASRETRLKAPSTSSDERPAHFVRRSPVVEIPVRRKMKRSRSELEQPQEEDDDDEDVVQRTRKRARTRLSQCYSRSESAQFDEDGMSEAKKKETSDSALAQQQLQSESRRSAEAAIGTEQEVAAPGRHLNQVGNLSDARAPGKWPGRPQQTPVTDNMATEGMVPREALLETIQSQFSLEILLKHRELRLIEQELAKCQTAYEQLRRCRLIPFPTASTAHETELGVQSDDQEMDHSAVWAPSAGVTDGPYARHYAQWLITDSRFGDMVAPESSEADRVPRKPVIEKRVTRKISAETGAAAGSRRRPANPAASKSRTAVRAPSPTKDRTGPPVMRRSSDGQLVKLVCVDCARTNFSSPQGFINHCRIAHGRGFESHDAAANACGQPVELDESGHVVGEADDDAPAPRWLVHPFIRSAMLPGDPLHPGKTRAGARLKNGAGVGGSSSISNLDHSNRQTRGAKNGATKAGVDRQKNPELDPLSPIIFVPSKRTPHLSRAVRRAGVSMDLDNMVNEACEKVDLGPKTPSDEEDDDEEEDGAEHDTEPASNPTRQARRPFNVPDHSHGRGVLAREYPSLFGARSPAQSRPASSGICPRVVIPSRPHEEHGPTTTRTTKQRKAEHDADAMEISQQAPTSAGPHAAPSLVPDDGDDEDDDDEYLASSDAESASTADERVSQSFDFEIEDHDEHHPADGHLTRSETRLKANSGRPGRRDPVGPGVTTRSRHRADSSISSHPSALTTQTSPSRSHTSPRPPLAPLEAQPRRTRSTARRMSQGKN
ncbi:MAG: hypothetical protein M1823_005046 [Watsoniomyces obsoletus]|nr:MAG: hypothetical protein M1823_005046 [Watsoniomyces obsoletus]